MALIIEGKMPSCCGSCRASGTDVCKSWFSFLKHIGEGRPIGCPIIGEIPDKHGDLVDRDYIKANGLSLNDAPVILEANT